jgi:hypothetical protein
MIRLLPCDGWEALILMENKNMSEFTKGPWDEMIAMVKRNVHCYESTSLANDDVERLLSVVDDLLKCPKRTAAPDMYEALKACNTYMTEKGISHEYPIMVNMRKALAKAEGKDDTKKQ